VAVGRAGARNAGLLAIQILAVKDPSLKQKFLDFRTRMAAEVAAKDHKLRREPA
jgi:phosphoribosylcarboxyaminoimidazole (NCAIR) mutase